MSFMWAATEAGQQRCRCCLCCSVVGVPTTSYGGVAYELCVPGVNKIVN